MRVLLILAGLLLLASCQRDYPEGHPATTANASSIWDYVEIETGKNLAQAQAPEEQPAAEIEPSLELGPEFSETDTVDETLLPGVWLQFCQTVDERLSPLPLDSMDVVEIAPNGQLAWHFVTDGKDNLQTGSWEKAGPGVVTLSLGEQQQARVVRLQMFGADFFFFWSYNGSVGMWFARIPENPAPRIMYNHFTSNLGEIHFDSVNDNIFQGTSSGDYPRTLAGVYTNGILVMRWEEPDTSAAGYAAFVVAPDWSELNGVWWIDDYQAAPFGGPYTAWPVTGEQPAPE